MKNFTKAGLAVAVIGSMSLWAGAETKGTPTPRNDVPTQVVARQISLQGTVQTVNPTSRDIKIQPADGDAVNMKVSPELAQLNTIKQGDQIKVDYLEPVAVAFQSSNAGEAVPLAGKTIQVTPMQSATPGSIQVNTLAMMSQVADVDRANRTVTLKQSDGNKMMVKVAPDVKGYDQLKIGDRVLAEYTQPVMYDISHS